jgi:hypothetical protein
MTQNQYDNDKIGKVLITSKNVAVVGISDKHDRESYRVARYLKENGFNIIPVNPNFATWEGITTYPSLIDIPPEIRIDIVDVFRKPETVIPVVNEAAKIGAKTIWFQEGVINETAANNAKKAGMTVVIDRCMMKEHYKSKNRN